MFNKTLAVVISSLLMAAATQAQASDAAAMAQQRWSEADTDRNGTLSQAEMQASMPTVASNFSRMDSNGDGQLSQDEMHNFKGSDQAQWNQSFKTADTDSDGSLTLAEAQAGMPMMASMFSTIDTDSDGKVTRKELATHHASMHGNADASMEADRSTTRSSTTSTTTTESDTDKPDGSSRQ